MQTEIDIDTYPILFFSYVFLMRDKKAARQESYPGKAQRAISHWIAKKAKRFAHEALPAGFAQSPIAIETERSPAYRGMEFWVGFSFATMPEHPGLNLTLHHDQGMLQIPRPATQ